jgi:hypothetical protein
MHRRPRSRPVQVLTLKRSGSDSCDYSPEAYLLLIVLGVAGGGVVGSHKERAKLVHLACGKNLSARHSQ